MKKIVCIGAAIIDIKARPRKAFSDNNFSVGSVFLSPGGVARNMAESLAKLDYDTYLLTAVGTDVLGELVINETRKSGTNVEFVMKCPHAPTTTYVAMLDERGTVQSEVIDVTVLEHISPHYLEQHKELHRAASLLIVDTNLLPESLQLIAHIAQENDIPLYVNTSSVPLATKVIPILSKISILSTNQYEAEQLLKLSISTPEEARAAGMRLLEYGVKEVIITLGAKGVVYCSSTYACYCEAFPAHVIETTGAGDALCAGFLSRYLAGDTINDCLEYGLAAAVITVESNSTVVANLSPALVESYLHNRRYICNNSF